MATPEQEHQEAQLRALIASWDQDADGAFTSVKQLYEQNPQWIAARQALSDMHLLRREWTEGYRLIGLGSLLAYLGLAEEMGHPRLSAVKVFSWAGRILTSAGMRNLDLLLQDLQARLDAHHDEHGVSLLEEYWDRLSTNAPVEDVVASVRDDLGSDPDDEDIAWAISYARDHADRLQFTPIAFERYDGLERPIPVSKPWPNPNFYGLAWSEFLRTLIRASENAARVRAGLPAVGMGLVSEVRLLNELREAFPDERIEHQVRPLWLRPQSLDIVFPERRVAVEYQGVQHTRPVEVFGGAAAFEAQLERDAMKRRLCEQNGMHLIEVHPDYTLEDVLEQVRGAIGSSPLG